MEKQAEEESYLVIEDKRAYVCMYVCMYTYMGTVLVVR